MPAILLALIPQLIGWLLPLAEHALGGGSSQDDQHVWVQAAVKDLMHDLVFKKLKLPVYISDFEEQIEKLVGEELQKLVAKI